MFYFFSDSRRYMAEILPIRHKLYPNKSIFSEKKKLSWKLFSRVSYGSKIINWSSFIDSVSSPWKIYVSYINHLWLNLLYYFQSFVNLTVFIPWCQLTQVVVTFDFCCSLYVLGHLVLVFSTFHLLQHDCSDCQVLLIWWWSCLKTNAAWNKLGSDHDYSWC